MTTGIMSFVFSPLSGLWSSLERALIVVGHSRAAAELTRMGYHAEAKQCMMEIKHIDK
jgi:hypothetical protein